MFFRISNARRQPLDYRDRRQEQQRCDRERGLVRLFGSPMAEIISKIVCFQVNRCIVSREWTNKHNFIYPALSVMLYSKANKTIRFEILCIV